jgi:hypothetical protein
MQAIQEVFFADQAKQSIFHSIINLKAKSKKRELGKPAAIFRWEELTAG